MRYVHTVPLTVNVGTQVFYDNKYGAGMALRTGQKTVNFNLKFALGDNFRIGYSYGISYGSIKPYQRGSHEIQVNYTTKIWQRNDRTVDLLWL
jgi:hypothetical protein